MEKVLLHICCAGCASVPILRLQAEGFKVAGMFYNPNIQPPKEYLKRKQDIDKIARKHSICILEDIYNPRAWFKSIKGYESEPEGAKRCEICFEVRLKRVYERMVKEGYDFFATTLTISPHKDSDVINGLGLGISRDRFLARNFKKKDGFKESVILSKELGLYRQNYCGCIYSRPQKMDV